MTIYLSIEGIGYRHYDIKITSSDYIAKINCKSYEASVTITKSLSQSTYEQKRLVSTHSFRCANSQSVVLLV